MFTVLFNPQGNPLLVDQNPEGDVYGGGYDNKNPPDSSGDTKAEWDNRCQLKSSMHQTSQEKKFFLKKVQILNQNIY